MSTFDDELRRMHEMERMLAPIREAERLRSSHGLANDRRLLFEAEERRHFMRETERQPTVQREAEQSQALIRDHDILLNQRRYGFLDAAAREALRFSTEFREREQFQRQIALASQPAFDSHTASIIEMLRQHDMLDQLKGARLEPTSEDFDFPDEEPTPSQIVVVKEISDELLSALKREPKSVRRLNSRKFEHLVAELLSRDGYEVEVTSATNDGGKDVVARLKTAAFTHILYVECKFYQEHHKVGIEIARQLFGVVKDDRVHGGLIVTTSSFTKGAEDLRRRNPRLLNLKAYDDLARWLQDLD